MKTKFLILFILTNSVLLNYSAGQKMPIRKPLSSGYIYQGGATIPFKYNVSYKTDTSGNYLSKYKVYIDGNYRYDVIAKHNKAQKKIDVEVDVAGGGILAIVAEPQTATYDSPSLKLFGIGGVSRVLSGDQIPNQLAIKFLDNRFTYVRVFNVLGYHGNDGADFFVFK